MLRYTLLLLLSFVPCHTGLANVPFAYRNVHEQTNMLAIDPIELLDVITEHVNEHRMQLSVDECDALIEQLQQIKQRLCWRPGAGLLGLPVLATIIAGGYAWINYLKLCNIQDAPTWAKILFVSEQEYCYNFVNSLLHFIVIATAAFFIEAEYRGAVNDLFIKERAIERKIDELITLLQ